MPRKPKPTPFALDIVQRLKDDLREAERRDHLTLTHRIPVISPEGGASLVFTVDVSRGRAGRLIATCREMIGLIVSADAEDEVLARAELEIRRRLRTGQP